ncbi:uncharacterized protein [Battus philenor]|uniref:uncharacterized protein n=1 Tax=Battus philenor TaxID=42288 RepID=UPI0035CEAB5D
MNATTYKKYHESFMEDNHGTTVLHTFFRVFFTVQTALLCSIRTPYGELEQYAYEYVSIVLSMITAHTVFVDHLYLWNLIVFSFIMCELICTHGIEDIRKAITKHNNFGTVKIQSITCMRGLTYLITVFCILAVDFQDFPRYLAKTEKYGYSLMDTGVGLFIFMSGLVHKDVDKDSCTSIIKGNSKFVSVLISLGLVRYFSVKQLDYHEHVTEYGVHWNFFFTLAVCKLISSIILYYSKRPLLLCCLTLIFHEYLLYYGLQEWVFSDKDRITLIDANREGIGSSMGYVSLYLFAVHVRSVLNNNSLYRYKVLLQFAITSFVLWSSLYVVNYYRPTSRTLANAGFCIYLDAILITVVMVLYFFEILYQDKERGLSFNIPYILSAINQNGLIYFIVANLLTGFINLSIRTLFVSSATTFVILNAYMLVTLGLSVYLKRNGIKI